MRLAGLILILLGGMVSAAPNPLTFDLAKQRLERSIIERMPQGFRVEVEKIFVNDPAPANARLGTITPSPPIGNVSFELTWADANGFRHTFGTAAVKAYAKVAVSRLPIQHNEAFTTSNTIFEEREITPFLNRGYYTSWEDLAALRARGYVHSGLVLGAAQTQLPWMIVQGEVVDLTFRKGAISIVAKVRSMENGHLGDWIRVENPSSRKILQARVIRAGEVETR